MRFEKLIALGIAGLTMFAGLAPAPSYAQSDQKIVMRCTFDGYTNQTLDYVIDLSAKTVSLTHTSENSGRSSIQTETGLITQIADDKLTWFFFSEADSYSETDPLNRYTGQIVAQVTQQGHNVTNLESCQRQQKQF